MISVIGGAGDRVIGEEETQPAEPASDQPVSLSWPASLGFPTDIEWGMQLAVRYDKQHLATHVEVCQSAARAVVCLLTDPRSVGTGQWADYLRHWRNGRIRKLVRRARGIRWEEVQALPGVTVREGPGDRAQIRAFVPAPVRPLPPELAKLQVSGTQFPRSAPGEMPALDEVPQPRVVTIALSPLAELSTGKAAAQCGHAAQLAWEALVRVDPAVAARWLADDARVRVIEPDARDWRRSTGAPIRVIDAGLTEVDGPTESARAWW